MQATYNLHRQAFLTAVQQFDMSTLSPELQQEINVLCDALKESATEDKIKQIHRLVEKSPQLKQLYDEQRLKLKTQEGETERNKGIPPKNDNPKSEELGSRNINPPTPPNKNSNSQSSPSTQSTNKNK